MIPCLDLQIDRTPDTSVRRAGISTASEERERRWSREQARLNNLLHGRVEWERWYFWLIRHKHPVGPVIYFSGGGYLQWHGKRGIVFAWTGRNGMGFPCLTPDDDEALHSVLNEARSWLQKRQAERIGVAL